MKTFVFVVCALVSVMIVYGAEPEKLIRYHRHRNECAKEFNISKDDTSLKMIDCISRKEGMIEQGVLIKEKVMKHLEELITDSDTLIEAKKIYLDCVNRAKKNTGNLEEKLNEVLLCSLPLMDMVDTTIN